MLERGGPFTANDDLWDTQQAGGLMAKSLICHCDTDFARPVSHANFAIDGKK